jgi:hypothetical protein
LRVILGADGRRDPVSLANMPPRTIWGMTNCEVTRTVRAISRSRPRERCYGSNVSSPTPHPARGMLGSDLQKWRCSQQKRSFGTERPGGDPAIEPQGSHRACCAAARRSQTPSLAPIGELPVKPRSGSAHRYGWPNDVSSNEIISVTAYQRSAVSRCEQRRRLCRRVRTQRASESCRRHLRPG